MRHLKLNYRKNYWLIITFIVLIVASFGMALSLAYNLTHKFVLNEFEGSKIDVLDKSIASYNDFVQNRIAEASFYQGYLDSISAKKYADTILANVPLVERI